MAIRSNCIEYAWQTTSSFVLSGSYYQTPLKSFTIPETTSRQFTDVSLVFHGRNSGREVTTVTSNYTMSIQIDSNPTSSYLVPQVGNQSLRNVSHTLIAPFTDYFNQYFTSSKHNVSCYIKSPVQNTIGQNFKVITTYKFDDAATTTSIKTVRIPIGSVTGSTLSTTRVYLGEVTASIPLLDTFLPEVSKSFTDIFVEYHSNDTSAATTQMEFRSQIDTAVSASRFVASSSALGGAYFLDIETLQGVISTATTHSIRVASTVASRFSSPLGILYCTYEYDYTGSSTILNSVILGGKTSTIYTPPETNSSINLNFYIPETGSIQLATSGMLMQFGGSSVSNVKVSTNSASFQNYSPTLGAAGGTPLMSKLDGTGSIFPSISIASGWNTVPVYINYPIFSVGGILLGSIVYLNYYSGVGRRPLDNNHTIITTPSGMISNGVSSTTNFYTSYLYSASLDSTYFLNSVSNVFYYLFAASANAPIYDISEHSCYLTGSEVVSMVDNPVSLGSLGMSNSQRFKFVMYYGNMTPWVMQFPEYIQPRPKFRLTNNHTFASRQVNVTAVASSEYGHHMIITQHSTTFSITGSIQNYSGSGANIPLVIYNYDTGEKLFTTQSKTGGVIDTYWYDKHSNLILIAETGSRYVSNVLPAGSGSFSITIPTASVGAPAASEKSFTFIS